MNLDEIDHGKKVGLSSLKCARHSNTWQLNHLNSMHQVTDEQANTLKIASLINNHIDVV